MKQSKFLAIGIIGLTMLFFSTANAQCYVMSDTLIGGIETGNYSTYQRNASWELEEVQSIDLIDPNNSTRDTAYYNPDGTIDKIESYRIVGNMLFHTITFTYNGLFQVTRADEVGDNGGGTWTKSFDYTYNGADELTDVILDAFSISGSPEGLLANFETITFTSGNISSFDLIGDFGGGVDTIELMLAYDANANTEDQFLPTEALDMIFVQSVNNLLTVKLVNDETLGNAGDLALEHALTYDGFGKVLTLQNVPAIFETEDRTTLYVWDCTASIDEIDVIDLTIYPNPAESVVKIKSEAALSGYEILTLNGQQIQKGSLALNEEIDIQSLESGIYLVRLTGDGITATRRLTVR